EQYGFDQAFTMPAAAPATLRGSAVLFAPSLVNRYVRLLARQPRVGASSRYTRAPQDQPRSAFDGNPATTWIASPGDANPVLTISWRHRLTVRTVTIQRPPGADGPLPVLVSGERGQARGGVLGPAGVLRFAPMRTRELAFRFSPPQTPLQISGVTIPRVPALQTPSGTFRLPCGLGPVVELDGRVLPTQVTGTFTELLGGQPMSFTACPAARAAAAGHRPVRRPGRRARDAPGRRGARHSVRRVTRACYGGRHPVLDPGPAGPGGRRDRPVLPGGERELQRGLAGAPGRA